MAGKIKDFLREDHPTVAPDEALAEVIERLLDTGLPESKRADCFVVPGPDGRPAGLINGWLALHALAIGAEKEGEPAVDALMKERLKLPVSSAMATEFPVASPEDDLFDVLRPLGRQYFECLPVMQGDKYLGAARTIDLFQAVAEEILSGGAESQAL